MACFTLFQRRVHTQFAPLDNAVDTRYNGTMTGGPRGMGSAPSGTAVLHWV